MATFLRDFNFGRTPCDESSHPSAESNPTALHSVEAWAETTRLQVGAHGAHTTPRSKWPKIYGCKNGYIYIYLEPKWGPLF